MPRCIFCGDESDKLSSEHIFPAALGGKLELKNASCTACNNGFSKSFEQAIATRLKDFRYIFQIPDRYGKVPELFAKAEVEGKQLDVKLLQDGKVQLKPERVVPGLVGKPRKLSETGLWEANGLWKPDKSQGRFASSSVCDRIAFA